ncbi:hypothetical protein ACMFMG_010178 [Clarireedia jacksonii]
MFPYGDLKWKLIDGLEFVEMGLWFDIHHVVEPAPATMFKGFAYGSFLVAETTKVFAFIAASKEVEKCDFLVRLSASMDFGAKSNLKLETVLKDSRFANLDLYNPGDTWTLPSSLQGNPSPLEALNSASANLASSFTQKPKEGAEQGEKITYDTSLLYAYVSIGLDGNWKLFQDFSLYKLIMGLLIRHKQTDDKQSDRSYKSLEADVRGIFDVGTGPGARKIDVTAMFAKDENNKSFTARLATYLETSDGRQQKKLEFSPGELLSIPALGGRMLSDSELTSADSLPANFPVQKEEFLSAVAIECEILVTKTKQTGDEKDKWSLSRIQLWVESTKTVEIIQGSLFLLDARLALTVSNLGDAQRTTLFTAETTVQIGAVTVKAGLRRWPVQSSNLPVKNSKTYFQREHQELPPDTARVTAESTSTIAMYWHYACPEGIALFFNPSGGIRMLRIGQGNLQIFDLVPDADAAPNSGLESYPPYAGGKSGCHPLLVAVWVSNDGSVWCAYGEEQSAGPSTGQWKRRQVTAPGSAHTSTRFQINSTSYNETVLFFFNPVGRLCTAVASFVKRDSDGKSELKWSLSDFEPEIRTLPDCPVDFKIHTIFPFSSEHDLV